MKFLTGKPLPVVYLLYFLLHVGFDLVARAFAVPPGISLWYPPVGLALALATVRGWRSAPAILLANLATAIAFNAEPLHWTRFALPLLITAVYVGAGALVRRYYGPVPSPTKPLRVAGLVALFLAAPAIGALVGSTLILAAGWTTPENYPPLLGYWCIGDLTGVLTVTPLLLVHVAPRLAGPPPGARRTRTRRELVEIAAQAAAVLGCVWLIHGVAFIRDYHAYYLSFVPLIWICLRHGLPGATIATFALTLSSLAAVRVFGGSQHVVVDLLLFVISIGAVGLGLGSAVTRRQTAERERSRLLSILEATTDFIGTCDMSGRILYRNAAFIRLRGLDPHDAIQGRHIRESHPAWAVEKLQGEGFRVAAANGIWQGESAFLDAAGNEVPVSQLLLAHYDEEGRPVMLSTIARDIGAQKKAERLRLETERNLLQAQKLESLGVLAGGIAHDFNNLLTAMLGNATLARLDVPAHSPAEKSIHQIELAALRAAELCRQMLAYSGQGRVTSALVDLSRIVEETTHLLQVSIPKKCALHFELDRALPPVQGDPTQLSQIAMNLVMNAADAVGDRAGRIVVRTGRLQADRAYLATTYLSPNLEPGPYVFLEVTDDGCGMTPEVIARLFEPFFTTKFTGHGLGLSAVLGIARGHQGAVKVDSTPGRGTTFRLLLPAAAGSAPAAVGEDPAATAAWRGHGRALLVDDEEAVRDVSARVLEHHGFQVTPAVDGRDAIAIFRRDPQAFRFVLLDLLMPVMDGAETCRELQRLNPAVPVILMSGYSESASAERFRGQHIAGFVQKPFENAKLVAVLRGILDLPRA